MFDLDNTLYPADSNLFAQIDVKMGEFIAKYLDVSLERARYLQKNYYRQFGTTLSGLMKVHNMDPTDFLDYVHDIDLAPIPEHPELADAIASLPGKKYIFTAGSRRHAENVAGKIGVLHLFDDIMDIVDTSFIAKEKAEAYDTFLKRHDVDPAQAAMFEDMPHKSAAGPHARHDDDAGSFELRRPSGAVEDPRMGCTARAYPPHDRGPARLPARRPARRDHRARGLGRDGSAMRNHSLPSKE